MRDGLNIVVPVAVVHISHQTTRSLWQVRRILLDSAIVRQSLYEDYLSSIGRELEAVNTNLIVGELLAVRAVRVHAPYLTSTDVGNTLAALNPCRVALALG